MAMAAEKLVADLVCSDNATARDVWLDGFQRGLAQGTTAAQLSQEQQAELAAEAFYRLEAHREWLGKFVPDAVAATEVEANRRKPGSSYIPRRGDTRYSSQPVTNSYRGGPVVFDRNTPMEYALPEHEDPTVYSPDAPIIPGGVLDRLRQRAGVPA
jgi:hypothetical protein